MNILESILGAQAQGAVAQLGQQFGLSNNQASSALEALLPSIAAGFSRNASSADGLGALVGALSGGRHGGYLDQLSSLANAATATDGNGILGHIFGSKDVSREVASRASAQTGIGADVLKKMLPIVAALAMGALAKKQFGGASQAGFQPQAAPTASGGGGLLDIFGSVLDANRNGSMVDDVIGMIGKAIGGALSHVTQRRRWA